MRALAHVRSIILHKKDFVKGGNNLLEKLLKMRDFGCIIGLMLM